MAEVYAILIMKGKKTMDKVPQKIRADVQRVLIDAGFQELAQEEGDN